MNDPQDQDAAPGTAPAVSGPLLPASGWGSYFGYGIGSWAWSQALVSPSLPLCLLSGI